jgi:hypothetical protein
MEAEPVLLMCVQQLRRSDWKLLLVGAEVMAEKCLIDATAAGSKSVCLSAVERMLNYIKSKNDF